MNKTDETQVLLYGEDDTQRIVGIDCDAATSKVHVFQRASRGNVAEQSVVFKPYLYSEGREILRRAGIECEVHELVGEAGFNLRARFPTCQAYDEGVKALASCYRSHKADFAQQPYYEVKEFAHQYMTAFGLTHFLDMEWEEVWALHLALKLNVSEELAEPGNKEHCILELGLLMGDELLVLKEEELGEKELLAEFVRAIQRFDPDVICGHKLYKHILSFITARARAQRVPLDLGRGERKAWSERYVMPLAERRLEFPRMRVFGRSLVDTWILAQGYDVFKREMDSYELPQVACYLGHGEKQRESWNTDEALAQTSSVVQTLIPNYFHLSQMLPYSLEECIIKGNATKINGLLLREYYRADAAVPYPAEGRVFPGGYTDVRLTGVVRPVINVDVASLYPSLILLHRLFPSTDRLGVFAAVLHELLARRLKIKRQLGELSDQRQFARLDAEQGTFKIIINSFYGYLGTSHMNFADLRAAARVTELGQQTVKRMAEIVEELGASIVEIDTDGIYLQPPERLRGPGGYDEFVALITRRMPEGINVELGGVYEAMLSYKVKNYALLDAEGKVVIKGSGLKSRGLEPFLRRFIEESIRLILQGRTDEVEQLFAETKRKLSDGEVPVRELAKTEILVDSLLTYQKKIAATGRNRQAQYEVALRHPSRFKPGDPVSYYITGDGPKVKAYEFAKLLAEHDTSAFDVNIPYYQKRLAETYKRVQSFVGD